MSIDNATLMAFADGELTGEERVRVEAALAQDEILRVKLAKHQALRTRLSLAFDGALREPVPPALLAASQNIRGADIINLAQRRAAKWSVREWSAIAASLALGVLVGIGAMKAQAPMIVASDNGLAAHGALAHALDTQLASEEPGAVRIGLSFRAKDGDYCRTFDLTQSATSGLACHEGENWRITMTAAGAGGEVRMAGGSEEILAEVEAIIDGAPLDAAAEREARRAQWR
jgi:hypothetical protein